MILVVGLFVLLPVHTAMDDRGELEVICSPLTEVAVVGDDVTLQCHLNSPFDVRNLTVEWSRGSIKSIVHVCRNGKDYLDDQIKQYRGRTSVSHEQLSRGNLSLKLLDVNQSDAGRYRCSVRGGGAQYINLTVDPANVKQDQGNRKDEPGGKNSGIGIHVITGIGIAFAIAVGIAIGVGIVIGIGIVVYRYIRSNRRQEEEIGANSYELESLRTGATEGGEERSTSTPSNTGHHRSTPSPSSGSTPSSLTAPNRSE